MATSCWKVARSRSMTEGGDVKERIQIPWLFSLAGLVGSAVGAVGGGAGREATVVYFDARGSALARANAALGDDDGRYPWQVFADLPRGAERIVVVVRKTGECGGCGALTYAVAFDGDRSVVEGVLGRFGRFGSGPDRASWRTIGDQSFLELGWSEGGGGWWADQISLYPLDGDEFRDDAICITTTSSNKGAYESESGLFEWSAEIGDAPGAGLIVRYTVTSDGGGRPSGLAPKYLSSEALVSRHTECIAPREP